MALYKGLVQALCSRNVRFGGGQAVAPFSDDAPMTTGGCQQDDIRCKMHPAKGDE
ncbi:MAG: hypothetical protein P9C48_14635 [Defluviicoccus sp.]|nr:hypothetical protein [Defluviicoccus sp.]MDG4610357.1 hypothetical protein [Defluviicoccus sp.]